MLLKSMSNLGNPMRIKFVPSLAFSIARQRSTTNKAIKPLGKNWTQGLEKRHPALESRRVRAIDWEQHKNNIYDKITHCFDVIGEVLQDPDILPDGLSAVSTYLGHNLAPIMYLSVWLLNHKVDLGWSIAGEYLLVSKSIECAPCMFAVFESKIDAVALGESSSWNGGPVRLEHPQQHRIRCVGWDVFKYEDARSN